jgi:tetratricopeptide (TPR) repeat protein
MFKKKKTATDPKKLWETYLKASLKQDWEKAKGALQSIIKLEPGNSKTHLKMGDLLQKMGNNKGAIKSYHRSAQILVKSGFGQKALALYKIILRLDPKDEEALSGSKGLLESPGPEGPALPAFSPDESPPLKPAAPAAQSTGTPAEESEVVSEELPSPEEMPPVAEASETTEEGMPTLTGLPEAEEPSPSQTPETTEWPGQEGIPSGWPEEEGETAAEAEAGEAMPELDLEIPETEAEESILGLYESSEVPKRAAPIKWSGTLPEIFWSLTKEELAQIINDSTVRTFQSGDKIVKEGDSGDSIYAIMEGSAKVRADFGGKSVDLASLGEGDVFGEVAFLSGRPRTATVVAESDARVMDISRSVLEKAIEKHPRILSCLAEYYHNRVKDTLTKVKRAKRPKTRFTIRD